jgi:hypothetical protein
VREEEAQEAQPGRLQVSALKQLRILLGFALLLFALLAPAAAQADFGIKNLTAGAVNENGSINLQAGSHPFAFKLAWEMNQDAEERPEGTLREFVIDLPPGMVGNPQAVPRCSGAQFEGVNTKCPVESQIGLAVVREATFSEQVVASPIYNLTPPQGVPASIGFSIASNNVFNEASLRSSDYGVRVSDITVPTSVEVQSVEARIWGVPALGSKKGEGHFGERCVTIGSEGCASSAAKVPFLSMPTSCTGPLKWTLSVKSVQEPNSFQTATVESVGFGGTPRGLVGCEKPPFDPTISARLETVSSDSPTGLHFNLHIPQHNAPVPPEMPATAHLKDTVVTLPAGLAVNPSAAIGRTGCPLTGPEGINLPGSGEPAQSEPAKCPDASKVGTVEVQTPLIDHPLPGMVYLARQGENPFGSLIALYVEVNDPLSGIVVKLAGKVEPNPITGQLTATFENNPQVPFEDFDFNFFGGPGGALTTPSLCGTYTTSADLTPWTSPEGTDALRTDAFSISSGADGGPCPASEVQMPNGPGFKAGVVNMIAGAYSTFGVKLSRENGSQRFGALNTTLPSGVTANFSGVAECSDAQIAAAASRSAPGQGALERQSPSCPTGSQIGTVNVGAGSGNPIYVQGNVYLAGPYKNAPFSLAIITPGVAGPFDIGTVVVRAALYVNEETGQGMVRSDPIPQILAGIPLDVRSITAKIDRAGYVLNPTSCEAKEVTAESISTTGQVANLTNHFQVSGCKALEYSPKLALSLKGATRRSGHPALKTVLTQPSGQANSKKIQVILPPTEFIDQAHISNPCTRPQFAEGKCPAASVLGKARVFTPLLAKPLEGPVYFRANGGARELPDIVLDLKGRIHIVLVGFVDAVHRKGSESSRVRTTFAHAPDAPVTKAIVKLKGGKKGTLVNSANICEVANIATVKMSAQSNKASDFDRKIATDCSKR